ncbi:hypothetical protein [Montanilutibacter psychrotolerans]|uniref:hypothetical protein n=1 Tax=Montanilutibacter psychrotolerans TaxID=1327343 RepID=UPI0011CE52D7|nr:hypothetical protein [Lysobacter psychrotolerans]
MIQAPNSAQSWNAYTYVFNNPLRYTDPTGMIGIEERQWAGAAVAIVMTAIYPGSAQLWYSMLTGMVAGWVSTGSMQGAITGAISAGLFAGIGSYFDSARWANAPSGSGAFGSGLTWGGYGAKSLSHGVAGGVMSSMQGGKFGHGFASAGAAQAFSPMIDTIGNNSPSYAPKRIAAAAIAGGATSMLSGGKFANGAITAAFSRALNDEASRSNERQYGFPDNWQSLETNFVPYFTDDQAYLAASAVNGVVLADWVWSFNGETAKIGIGDMSLSDGSSMRPHRSHTDGLSVDLRPIRTDGSGGRPTWRSSTYDRAATQRLVNALRVSGNVDYIYFNDPGVTGLKFCCTSSPALHDNHLHVRYKK